MTLLIHAAVEPDSHDASGAVHKIVRIHELQLKLRSDKKKILV